MLVRPSGPYDGDRDQVECRRADVPRERRRLAPLQLEGCGKWAGVETFEEVVTDGKITLILGGKALIVGIGLAVDRRHETRPNCPYQDLIRIARQRETTEYSVLANRFLTDRIQEFPAETDKPLGEQDTKKAERPMRGFLAHRKGAQDIAKWDQHDTVFSLNDPSAGPFRSQRHPWRFICSNHNLFPPISVVPLTPLSLIPVSQCTSLSWVGRPSTQPLLHRISQTSAP